MKKITEIVVIEIMKFIRKIAVAFKLSEKQKQIVEDKNRHYPFLCNQ